MAEPGGAADPEVWSRRLAAIAKLVPADAVAVLLPLADGRYIPFATHGLRADATIADLLPLVASAVLGRRTQRRAALGIPLADGRVGEAALVAPLVWNGQVVGAFAALRAGGPFVVEDAETASRIAPLVALELAEAGRAQRSAPAHDDVRLRRVEEDRRHAIALYEVAKAVAGSPDAVGGTDRAVAVLAESLHNDVVAVWDHEGDGTLRPLAWRGIPPGSLATRTDADTALMRVTLERRTQVTRPRPGAAWAGGATDLVLAPIASDGRISGVLLLGRNGRAYSDSEVALASTLAEIFAQLRRDRPAAVVRHHDRSVVEKRPAALELPDPAALIASAPRSALEPPGEERRAMPRVLLGLAAALAIGLAATAALGFGGPLLYVLAVAVALAAAWAALGSGLGQQFLLLAALVAFVERASAPVIAGAATTEALAAAGAGALLAVVTAGVAASVLRRERR